MKPSHATQEVTPSDKPKGLARKILVALGVAFIAYGVIGWLVVPPLAKKLIADKGGEALGRVVQVDDVSVNPYTLAATVSGVRVLEADRRTVFASFDRLDIDGSVRSLTRLAPVADEVTLSGLKVRLVRDGESHYNLSDLLARLAQPKAKARKDEEPGRFSLSNIRLAGAALELDDRVKGTVHRVADLDIAIPFISNLPSHLKEYVQPRLSARVNGAPLAIRGETLPFENSLRTHVTLRLDGFDVKRYAAYSPSPLPVEVRSGKLGGNIVVKFSEAAGKDAAIDVSGRLVLDDVAIATPGGDEARADRIEADVASFDPLGGIAKVSAVRVSGAQAGADPWRVAALEAGDISLDLHAHKVGIGSLATKGGELALHRVADGSVQMPIRMSSAPDSEAQPGAAPWLVTLGKATLDDYKVSVADAAVKPAAMHRVAITHLEASDLSSAKGAKNTVDAHIALDKGGLLDVRSTVVLDPLVVDAQVDARRIDLVPLRPYVPQFQTVALKSGRASAKGHMQLRGEGRSMRLAYAGSAAVDKLSTFDTVNKEDLLNWEAVHADGIAVKWAPDEPLDLAVADIAVNKAYSRVVVLPEGTINLQTLKLATPDDPAPAPQSPETVRPRNVRIDRVSFADSRLNFTDHYIKPNYTADVGELNGTVTGLSSEPQARAKVDLKGSWDKSSPVLIAGTINPLRGDLFLDIAARGKDIELSRLSAYSMRYAGYGIKQGKLTLDVKYHVEDGKLDGRNNILLEQLTFGDKVESPEATKLPVLFAVNLLKDSQGRINLELPIKGSLEDPEFDMGGLISQVVGNLLKKAVTSPFSLLAAALGGDKGSGSAPAGGGADDLAFVSFDPGRAEGGDAERAKLDRVSKALLDRPAVRIEMAPHTDTEKDTAALRRAKLRARLAQIKGSALGADDYARYLKVAYEQEFPPAKDAKAEAKKEEVPAEQMEAKLLERIAVSEQDLRGLAQRRAEWVRGYLVGQGKLGEDRVLLASDAAGGGGEAKMLTRVDFTLK